MRSVIVIVQLFLSVPIGRRFFSQVTTKQFKTVRRQVWACGILRERITDLQVVYIYCAVSVC